MPSSNRDTRRTAIGDFLITKVGELWGIPESTWKRHEHDNYEDLSRQLLNNLDATFSKEDLELGTAELLIFEDQSDAIEWWRGCPSWKEWEKRQRIGFGCWLWQCANPSDQAGQIFLDELRWESNNPDDSLHSRCYLALDVVYAWAGMPNRFQYGASPSNPTANPIGLGILKTFVEEHLQPWPSHKLQTGKVLGKILAYFKELGDLTLEDCREALINQPSVAISNEIMNSVDAELSELMGEVIYEFAEELTEENSGRFCYFSKQKGARWVIRACENVERLGLKTLQSKKPDAYDRNHAIRKIASIKDFLPDDDMEAFQVELGRFSPQTRQLVSICASVAAEQLLASPDSALSPEIEKFRQIFFGTTGYSYSPFGNSTDDTSGVFPIAELRQLSESMGEGGRLYLLEEFAQRGEEGSNALTLLKGLFEVDRSKIEKALRSHGQSAIKAYGMFSLPSGEADRDQELLTRYQRIQEFSEQAAKLKPERRAKCIAAARAALSNLAQVAGFPDSTQLQFALEAKLAPKPTSTTTALCEEPYHAHIELNSSRPNLMISKNGRALKNIPAALKTSDQFKQLRQEFELLLARSDKLSALLEAAMTSGKKLESSVINHLRSIPVARPLLVRLLIRTEGNDFGLLEEDGMELLGLRSCRHPLSPTFQIAHPLQLREKNILGEWQEELQSRQIVPPFPQANREVFLPVSLETGEQTLPSGLIGATLKSAKASKMLGAFGWCIQKSPDDYPITYKDYPEAQTRAFFLIDGRDDQFTANPTITIEQICFGSMSDPWWNHFDPLEIKSVPSLAFSETIRDLTAVIAAS